MDGWYEREHQMCKVDTMNFEWWYKLTMCAIEKYPNICIEKAATFATIISR